jgi:hypothetical protein
VYGNVLSEVEVKLVTANWWHEWNNIDHGPKDNDFFVNFFYKISYKVTIGWENKHLNYYKAFW